MKWQWKNLLIFTCDSIYAIARICFRPSVRLSVRPSITWVDQSKTVKVRIVQFSPYSSPVHPSSFCGVSFIQKFWRDPPERGIKQGWVGENKRFSSFIRQYLENGKRYDEDYNWWLIGSCIWAFDWHQNRWPWTRWRMAAIIFKYLN